jgi:hypothetical protein
MAKVNEMLESRFLKQGDIPDEIMVTVEAVAKKNVAREGDDPELKWLVKFVEFKKPMVLNATNIKRLKSACGSDDTDDWRGKKVSLYTDPDVEYAGNITGGLRIRAGAPERSKPAAGPKEGKFADMEDDIPF